MLGAVQVNIIKYTTQTLTLDLQVHGLSLQVKHTQVAEGQRHRQRYDINIYMLAADTATMFYTNKQVFIKGVQWVNNKDDQTVHQED